MKSDFRRIALPLFAAFLACVMLTTCSKTSTASPPEPFFRMSSPSGCSGGWFSTDRGLWGATCRHCVARPGQPVSIYLFKDGWKSPRPVKGVCYAAHPRHDCSIVYVPLANYPYHELPITLPLSPTGPESGRPLWAVGSFAGGTVHPAARKVAATSIGRYEFTLNDSAWGGHSGGLVIDATNSQIVGVLWGAGRGFSSVTSSRAIWETLYGHGPKFWQRAAKMQQQAEPAQQAFFSVTDNVDQPTERPQATIYVYGTQNELQRSGFYNALTTDPQLGQVEWKYMGPGNVAAQHRPQFRWHDGRTAWSIDGWPGFRDLCRRFGAANESVWSVQYCPTCPPNYGNRGGSQFPGLPNIGGGKTNPWNIIPPAPPQQPNTGSPAPDDSTLNTLRDKIRDLEDKQRKLKNDAEDEARRLKNLADDELRKVRREYEDRIRQLANSAEPRQAPGAEPASPSDEDALDKNLDTVLAKQQQRKRRAAETDRKLEAFVSKAESESPKGRDDWLWPGAILGAAGITGGAYVAGKRKAGPK